MIINLDLKEDFKIIEEGSQYELPCYEVVDGQGIIEVEETVKINFVRGSKLKGENVERRTGTLHEHLLSMQISDLEFKYSLVPSDDTKQALYHLKSALMWLRQRQIDRQKRNVLGTYQK